MWLLKKWPPVAAGGSVVVRLDFYDIAGPNMAAAGPYHTAAATCLPNTVGPKQLGCFEDVVVVLLKTGAAAAAGAVVVNGPLAQRCDFVVAVAVAVAASVAEIVSPKCDIGYSVIERFSLAVV